MAKLYQYPFSDDKNKKTHRNWGKKGTLQVTKPSEQFSDFKVRHQIEAKRTNDKASQLIKAHSSKCKGHINS